MSYEARVSEALAAAAAMTGWDFGWQRERTHGDDLSWSYGDLARAAISRATSLLDLDTGGGELLESLRPLPPPDAREELPAFYYHDIGAVVFQLTVVSWAIPDFDVHRYDAALRRLDTRIRADGAFLTHNHRYLISAEKPAG
ncbi:MAG TPA: hypothetical protein VE287_00965 [Actinopolymorphaceae bacterium]|jgi:hypothetical protein|nr:hypothetical protein [Actinopolymorphaceae bacterium]